MWAFAREESVVPAKDEDPNEVHMRAGQRILDDLDAAKESIGDQIRATASYMGEGS
jgi:hypothetical protein